MTVLPTGATGDPRVAVVAAGALLPGSPGVEPFWRTVVTGRDLMTDVPAHRWRVDDHYDPDPDAVDRTYGRRGAFLPEIDFDPVRYGVPPADLSDLDASQLLALVVAEQVLADCPHRPTDGERVSVVIGASALSRLAEAAARLQRPVWLRAMRAHGLPEEVARSICDTIAGQYAPWRAETLPGLLSNVVAGRIADRFGLHGVSHTTDAAGASSLAALHTAVADLTLGRSDLVITGGVDTTNDITTFTGFARTPVLSPSGDCRPFSADADGTMLGEGLVLFALKRLADAERAGDRVYAVVRGTGAASDGAAGATGPVPAGQARALRRAYETAGYGPETVELVEAHGTATVAGDAAEFAALREVFDGSGRADRQWCALGAVTSQIGHAKAAAGAAGLLKAVLALHHRVLPPTIKVERPNPALDLPASPFHLNTRVRPWITAGGHPRRASVSSFGIGGTHFHVALEEHPATAPPAGVVTASPTELVLLSAGSPAALRGRVDGLDPDAPLATLADRARAEFDPTAGARLAVVATDTADLRTTLAAALARIEAGDDPGPRVHHATGPVLTGGVGYLFPGPGARYVGMGGDLAVHVAAAREPWDRAARLGLDLHRVVFPPPVSADAERAAQEGRLTAPEWAQPALAAHSLALLAVLASVGLTADCLAGHSSGELVALHAAGAFDADTLLRLSRRRGELMAAVPDRGGMLAVGAERTAVEAVIRDRTDVWLAAHDAPGEVVVAGDPDALSAAADALAAAGLPVGPPDTAGAFHTPLVAPARPPLLAYLTELTVAGPRRPVYGTAGGRRYPKDPDGVRQRLADQVTEPVDFCAVVEAMYTAGVRRFVEIGPGSTLTGLVGRVLGDRPHLAVALDRRDRHGVTCLQDALGRLAVSGLELDLAPVSGPVAAKDPGATAGGPAGGTAPGTAAVRLDGGNPGRPFPPRDGSDHPPAAVPPPRVLPARAVPARAVPAFPTGDPDEAWLRVVEDAQRQTAQAHSAFQRAMTDSHLAYLRLAEQTLSGLLGTAGDVAPQPLAPVPVAPEPVAPEPVVPVSVAPEPAQPPAQRTPVPEPARRLPGNPPTVEPPAATPVASPVPPAAEAGPGPDGDPDEAPDGDPDEAPGEAPDDGEPVTRQAVRVRATAGTGLATVGLADGPVAVTDDGRGFAALVVAALRGRGLRADVIRSATRVPADAAGVILLDGLRAVGSPAEAVEVNRDVFRAARSIAARMAEHGGVFVTVQDTGGSFGLTGRPDSTRAWLGGLPGLVRTVAREWPRAAVKAIDCASTGRPAPAVADAIVTELLTGADDTVVGLPVDGTRLVPVVVDAPLAPEPASPLVPQLPVIGADAVVVATGGARGVTAEALRLLAARHRPRLVLLGRTPLAAEPPGLAAAGDEAALVALLAAREKGNPAQLAARARRVLAVREVSANLAAFEQAAVPVRYVSVDVRDTWALGAALGAVRHDWGPVTAIVHGAGGPADGRLVDRTDDEFARVFDTKVEGLRALLAATADDPVEVLCAFSSVASVFGEAGRADYAMANQVLNQVLAAEQSRRPDCLVRSIAWGPWRGGPAASGPSEGGAALIGAADGARAFVAEIADPEGEDVLVVRAGRSAHRPARGRHNSGP